MLCEIGGEVRRYRVKMTKFVVVKSLGNHTQTIHRSYAGEVS